MNLSKRNLYILGGAAAVIFILLLWILPQWQGDNYRARFSRREQEELSAHEKIQLEKNIADIENSNRVTLAQIIGGLALLAGLYFTYQNVRTAQDNLRVTEEGKLTDRFSKAVELLGSDKLDIRLGGIYALERIARDSQKDHWTVIEVLTAFVRQNAPWKPGTDETDYKLREDIQAAMTVIGRRKWTETETQNQRLDLRETNLRDSRLYNANLANAYLFRSNLSYAVLDGANLKGAYLSSANLELASLYEANLEAAFLNYTNLTRASLASSKLSRARFIETNVADASFRLANLTGADLGTAQNLTLYQIQMAESFTEDLLPFDLVNALQENRAAATEENAPPDPDE